MLLNKYEFDTFIQSQVVFDQHIISYIDRRGRQIYIDSLGELHSNLDKTIKVESMEKYDRALHNECIRIAVENNHIGKGIVTCHAFMSPKGAISFPMHMDTEDVIIHTVYGKKYMMIEYTGESCIPEGESIMISKGTMHQALNKEESLILSFGLEMFLSER